MMPWSLATCALEFHRALETSSHDQEIASVQACRNTRTGSVYTTGPIQFQLLSSGYLHVMCRYIRDLADVLAEIQHSVPPRALPVALELEALVDKAAEKHDKYVHRDFVSKVWHLRSERVRIQKHTRPGSLVVLT